MCMLLFDEDCALFAESQEQMQRKTDCFTQTAMKFELHMNTKKTVTSLQSSLETSLQPPVIRVNESVISTRFVFQLNGQNANINHIATIFTI